MSPVLLAEWSTVPLRVESWVTKKVYSSVMDEPGHLACEFRPEAFGQVGQAVVDPDFGFTCGRVERPGFPRGVHQGTVVIAGHLYGVSRQQGEDFLPGLFVCFGARDESGPVSTPTRCALPASGRRCP